jgi:DNA polymerase-3 subunit delta
LIIQSLEELENNWQSEASVRVCLILGPELYQCRMAVDFLKQKFLPPESFAFDYAEFSAVDSSVDQVLEAANTFPMISRKRFVLLTEADRLKDAEQEELLNSLDGLPPRCLLVIYAEDFDHRKKFYKTMRERHCVAEFRKLKGIALEQWARAFIQRHGYRCSSYAVKKIVDLAGSDLQMIAAELEKLLLYAGTERNIPDIAVEELVSASRQQGIFDFIGAIGRRDRVAALRSLANLISMGEHPLVIVSMLARHCRQVLIAKEYLAKGVHARDIGNAAQIPPFLLDIFLRQARAVDAARIHQAYIRLADMDRRLKSSSVDGRLLIESLICALV